MQDGAMVTLSDYTVLQDRVGQEVAVSPWLEVSQAKIDLFADATSDHQWIHVDPARARTESPYGATIAHGFMTLALLAPLFEGAVRFETAKMGVNYGLNRVRFTAPVPSGARVRGRFTLIDYAPIEGGAQLTWAVQIELEGSSRPACVVEWMTRRY